MLPLRHIFLLSLLCTGAAAFAAIAPIRTVGPLCQAVYEQYGDFPDFDVCARVNVVNFESATSWAELSVHDETGGINLFFVPGEKTPVPRPGDTIRAVGSVIRGLGNKHHAFAQSLAVLRHDPPPEPIPTTPSELLLGHLDFMRVRVEARIREIVRSALSPNWIFLGIIDGSHTLAVPVLASEPEIERISGLVGRTVVIDGFCSPADPGPLQSGRQIRICDSTVIQPLPEDDAVSIPAVGGIENIHPDVIAAFDLHSVSGTVIAVWQRQHALVRGPDDRLVRVDFRKPAPLAVGMSAVAVGFPESNFMHVNLINASCSSAKAGPPPDGKPTAVRLADLRRGPPDNRQPAHNRHGQLVCMRCRILTMPCDKNNGRMLVEDGGEELPVEAGVLMPALDGLAAGCEIELTGICVVEAEAWRSIAPHRIRIMLVPRSESDLVVLSRPSRLTPARLFAVIGILLAGLCGILLWNVLLRKAALRKGRELAREQLKHLRAETKAIERTRLAVELHDTLAQSLTGVSLEVAAAEQCGEKDLDGLFKHISIAAKTLDSCRRNLRDSLWDLRNRALEAHDMNTAIRKTLQPHAKGIDLVVRFNVLRSRLSERLADDILCIVRELALNGIRHGQATAIRIAGCVDGETLLFSVADNGRGFDPDTCGGVCDGHFGIAGIRERLSGLSGEIAYESAADTGTKAKVAIRLQGESEEN